MPYQILLVDDDQDFREELRESLHTYRIIEASSGGEALAIIRNPHAIDLILLDVGLPDLPGTEVLKRIKKIAPHVGVIMVTGQSSKDVAIEALKGRADDYIEKPFDVEKLHRLVQQMIAAKSRDRQGGMVLSSGKMERARVFLENNYDKKVSLDDVAQEVCLNPKYLSRVFKEKTGTGFGAYRLKIKMQMAQKMLHNGFLSVSHVAEKLGYKNMESFIRIFKKMTGKTPAQSRRKLKTNGPHA